MAEKRMFKIHSIYMITNTETKMSYIGRTCKENVHNRLLEHFRDSKYILNNCPLHKAMKEHKREDFIITKLCSFGTDDIQFADKVELDFIKEYDTFYPKGYNVRRVKNGR